MNDIKSENFTSIYKELAELVGVEMTLIIYNHYKGLQVVFPTRLLSREYIKKQLETECTGNSIDYKSLIRRFSYSERWLRKIISEIVEESQRTDSISVK